jgi:hypothetical protein
MRRFLILIITLLVSGASIAQDDLKQSPFSVNGYLEVYYTYDFNEPENNTRPGFVYSFNRHNEVNLNVGFIRGAYNTDRVRANFALMAGTYANANLAAEPGVLRNVYEANVGVKISSTKNLWVDAGIFGSHIGFESAVGKDCWNLTRGILADNTPYYEAGTKISYTTENGKWFLAGLLLNGWQRIQRVDGNSLPSFGTQVTFKPNSTVTLNSSTFIGTDKPDHARQMRYFHNFYGIIELTEKVGLTVGFDYGTEEESAESSATNSWMSPVVIARFALGEKTSIAIRGEYYEDEHGIIIATGTENGFKTTGLSANFDYQISQQAVWRLEVRNFNSKDEIFTNGGDMSKSNTFVTTSLAVGF